MPTGQQIKTPKPNGIKGTGVSGKSKIQVNYDIMRSLGHEKIDTTMIYLDKVFEKERHAIHDWKPEMFGEYI